MNIMNLIIASSFLVGLSVSAHASADNTQKVPCTFQDYQLIKHSLANGVTVFGSSLIGELRSVLIQEMGPLCDRVLQTPNENPGENSFFSYLITNGDTEYTVNIEQTSDPVTTFLSIFSSTH
jgi:hypothetical protein